jgi:hypothetical protein
VQSIDPGSSYFAIKAHHHVNDPCLAVHVRIRTSSQLERTRETRCGTTSRISLELTHAQEWISGDGLRLLFVHHVFAVGSWPAPKGNRIGA